MSDIRKELDDIMKKVSETTPVYGSNGNDDFIPRLTITSGLIDTSTLIKKLIEMEKYVDVNFTENGLIPGYIDFDRTNSDLYNTIEEILTVYVNNKKQILEEESIKNEPYVDEEFNPDKMVFIISSDLFKSDYKEDIVVDIKKYHENILKFDIENNKFIDEFDNVYNASREKYLELLDSNGTRNDVKEIYYKTVLELEKSVLEMREHQTELLFKQVDIIYNDIISNLVDDESIQEICVKFTMMKNAIDAYLIEFMDERYKLIKGMLLLDYHRTLQLIELNQDNGDDL